MNLMLPIGIAVVGYLYGSLSMARMVIRLFSSGGTHDGPTELRLEGSDKTLHLDSVSASSVSVRHGSRLGFMTFVLDVLKIFVPTFVLKLAFPDTYYFLIFAAAGMTGHVWPVYHGFKGGRGISAAYAGLLAIDPIGFLVCSLGGMMVGLLVVRDMWTAYCAGVWAIIPWLWFRTHDPAYLAYALAVNIVYMLGMIPETRQWFRIRREDKWDDTTEVMQLSGMGRGLLKMGRKLGIIKGSTDRR